MKRIVDILGTKAAAAVFAVFVSVCVCVLAVWWGSLNQDEGWYLYAARLVGEGKLPYRDFFFTQGPVLPFVYSALPLNGLLSGRLATLALSFAATAAAIAFARRLVAPDRRGAVSLAVFALLSCNLYHVYFTAIPKSYALGSLFLMFGFLLLSHGWNFCAALSFAFASGTRISLILVLGVAGLYLLVSAPRRLAWLRFAAGGFAGLFLVYGPFALDPQSLKGLLAAQAYHAARGGFDLFFAAGSLCRIVRGYLAAGAVLFAAAAIGTACGARRERECGEPSAGWIAGLSFAAVFTLQMCAPFPYDDYAVPIMPIPVVLISAFFANRFCGPDCRFGRAAAWFPVLAAGMCSMSSPLLQDWMTNGIDRFWPLKKDASELSQIRDVARKLEKLDPGGKTLLTQDLYLAVEMGRKIPDGLEMGPFSYFPELDSGEAAALHVMNRESMERLFESAPCRLAAFSEYGFAIAAPRCTPVPVAERRKLGHILRSKYDYAGKEDRFGQNHTMLQYFLRKPSSGGL